LFEGAGLAAAELHIYLRGKTEPYPSVAIGLFDAADQPTHPFYTPIATFGSKYDLEPVAYGLKFAGALSGGTFLQTDLTAKIQAAGVDATAYAAKLSSGHVSVIILNKDAAQDLDLSVDFGSGASGKVEIESLHAPALESREARITGSAAHGVLKQGKYTVAVPHASGLRLTLA
jgi:hypothetical protein